ncbi:hypothetical protein H5410_056915, partial [Solanum commersonii]
VALPNNNVYNVHHKGRTCIICLKKKMCTYKRFQMDKILCSHAWTPNTLLITYNNPITPLPDLIEWNVPEYIKDGIVRPPKFKRLSERPPKKLHDKA